MHDLLEYGDNYFMTSERLCNYLRDKVNIDANEKINNNKATTGNREHSR